MLETLKFVHWRASARAAVEFNSIGHISHSPTSSVVCFHPSRTARAASSFAGTSRALLLLLLLFVSGRQLRASNNHKQDGQKKQANSPRPLTAQQLTVAAAVVVGHPRECCCSRKSLRLFLPLLLLSKQCFNWPPFQLTATAECAAAAAAATGQQLDGPPLALRASSSRLGSARSHPPSSARAKLAARVSGRET